MIAAADHEAVGAVGFAAWAASDAFEDSYLDPDVITRVRHEFAIFPEETKGEIFLGERGGTIVGWGARENQPNYVSDLWVHPDHQGNGVGRALLLNTHAGNKGAIRLYERCGFTIIWRGREFSESMGVELEKVHLEKRLADR
ncbi:GNAT family N-acetyltransferase [Rhizobium laguerreae]|uniref:GNAT family N-acetyltransferase n=1 Tax=Rhizobium laguerreae TaxID=1076926 RepID=A0A7Y2W541_9HYPH|nr:GNAT family N-acetyltransferase [Rhizobium laguerreae]NNH63845.1 GNAT family N-acetyltransferase [Rhizobium laguerreae]